MHRRSPRTSFRRVLSGVEEGSDDLLFKGLFIKDPCLKAFEGLEMIDHLKMPRHVGLHDRSTRAQQGKNRKPGFIITDGG